MGYPEDSKLHYSPLLLPFRLFWGARGCPFCRGPGIPSPFCYRIVGIGHACPIDLAPLGAFRLSIGGTGFAIMVSGGYIHSQYDEIILSQSSSARKIEGLHLSSHSNSS